MTVDLDGHDGGDETVPIEFHGRTIGVIRLGSSSLPPTTGEATLVEAVAHELGAALHTAELFAERARQARVERGFYRIATLLGEPLALAEASTRPRRLQARRSGATRQRFYLRGAGGLGLAGGHELPGGVRELLVAAVLARVAADSQVLAAPALADDERFDDEWRDLPVRGARWRSRCGGDTRGIVLVFFGEERDLHRRRPRARPPARPGGARRARAEPAVRRRAQRARRSSQQLARTGSLLATELDPAAVLDAVVEQAAELLRVDAATAPSLDEATSSSSRAAAGDGRRGALGARVAGDRLARRRRRPVAGAGRAPRTRAPSERARGARARCSSAGYRAYLGVPLAGPRGRAARRPRRLRARAARLARGRDRGARRARRERVVGARERRALPARRARAGAERRDPREHRRRHRRRRPRRPGRALERAPPSRSPACRPTEALGRTPAQVLHRELESEDGRHAPARLDRARRRGGLALALRGGHARPGGAVAGRIFAFRDISAERLVEQMKSDFVSTVSHELRTPLTSIYGFAETLLREDVAFGEEERRDFLGYIASRVGAADRDRRRAAERRAARHRRPAGAARADRRRRARRRGRRGRRGDGRRTATLRRRLSTTSRSTPRPTPTSCARCSTSSSTTRLSSRPTAARSRSRRGAGDAVELERRRRGHRHPRAEQRADLLEVLPRPTARRRRRHRSRPLHRAGTRRGDGRPDPGRLDEGGGSSFAFELPRVRRVE